MPLRRAVITESSAIHWLIWLGVASSAIMLLLGVGFFCLLYVWQGVPFDMLFENGVVDGIMHFLGLGGISALIWAPIMLLSLAGIPRTWVKETW